MIRCDFCGNMDDPPVVTAHFNVCLSCITDLIENEAERRGVAEEERRFRQHWSGVPTSEDRDRDALRDAGRL